MGIGNSNFDAKIANLFQLNPYNNYFPSGPYNYKLVAICSMPFILLK